MITELAPDRPDVSPGRGRRGIEGRSAIVNATALDATFQALADPTRRAIIERLSRRPASVSELARPLEMTLPAVMQHLAVLEQSGLVRSRKTGRVRTCEINPAGLAQAGRWIERRRLEWERRLDRLGEYLETLQKGEQGDVEIR